ncbi:Na+/H+ antiporter NhaC family protein [Evansella halocellulosilytica]|uniref:Na+/H+ antiporter NhaC family protein n=1 Tax=Evansella halocellulosilytica TaxID=2011013 RepID=UPI000BB71B9C|nr:Na+/H+ antiporter NhaC family protein [Evansella halocellulosilytica]
MNKRFSIFELVLVLGVTVSSLMTAILVDFSLVGAILPGLALLVLFSKKNGYTYNDLLRSSWTGVVRNKNVAWLLAFIGIILPTWFLSGTITDLNQLFLSLIAPKYFFVMTFLIATMMSLIVGSAVGSLSIVGVPLIATAEMLGLPLTIVAGALVSGAFVGDRTSPLSSSFQLLAFSVELNTKKHFQTILPTMVITAGITALIFLLLDISIDKNMTTGIATEEIILHPGSLLISLIPPFVLLVMILLGKNMKLCFSLGIATAGIILIFRGEHASEWVHAMIFGISSFDGLQSMASFIIFILLVGAYCQMIEDTGMVQPYIHRIFTNKTSLAKNTAQTVGVAAGVSLISPNQSFPIILTGRSLLPHWQAHFNKEHLARVIADSTVVFAGLIPWSLLAILCSAIIQVPVLEYAPFAIFLWLSMFVTLGYSMKKRQKVHVEQPVQKLG